MRSLADQTIGDLGGTWSVLTRQKRDHERLDRLLRELKSAHGIDQERVLSDLARLVFPHAFAEESVLWPLMRHLLPDGDELTVQVEQEHQEVNELWVRLDSGPESTEREQVIARLREVLSEDVRDEEDELLPRLQAGLSRRQLRWLGVAWEAVRRTAPTRPHPDVSRRPPGNVLAAAPLAVIDRARDAVDALARASFGSSGSAALRLRRLSRVLGAVGRRVERLAPLEVGEDPTTRT
jgi:hypothetical protein